MKWMEKDPEINFSAHEDLGYFGPEHKVSNDTTQKIKKVLQEAYQRGMQQKKEKAEIDIEILHQKVEKGEDIDWEKEDINNYPGKQADFLRIRWQAQELNQKGSNQKGSNHE
ncbi:MAG: hypothetical protein M1554_02700 [Patescibacteria group bacterium]|nr:hypothetical protein [Patescibacteria group bacterium]